MCMALLVDEALILYRDTLRFRHPHPKVVRDVCDWMKSPTRGNIRLLGDDRDIWSAPDTGDLLVGTTSNSTSAA
jgi:hypothetical protein